MRRPNTEMLRCRVDRQLRGDLEFLARVQLVKLSDIVRIACHHYIQKHAPKGLRLNGKR